MAVRIEIDHVNEKNRSVQELPENSKPDFSEYEPDIRAIKDAVEEHSDEYDSLVVIGNGGSITSFRAYLYAFMDEVDKDVRLVTTMDPDYLNRLDSELETDKTLVMPISKSGNTTGVIESLLYFMKRDYPVFAVTSDNDGALKQIVEREKLSWIEHPDIGGRFTGLVETALTPAAFAGIDIDEIRRGGVEMYEKIGPENQYNPALNIASALYDAEKKGYEQVFTPFYSTRMFGFYPLFVQLMHETVCKHGEGQSVFGDLGPECQHHTNQRVFGGKKDVITMFFRSEVHEREEISVPDELKDVDLRGRALEDLDTHTFQSSLEAEYAGVKEAMNDEEMPNMTISVRDVSYDTMGKLMALLQYIAVYSAWLRDVDPFNQPDVEKSKSIGFEERFKP
ncbi:MAG: hypothetical protein ABEJ99_00215 [Candidatus Nanohaloarchaea archaeon]